MATTRKNTAQEDRQVRVTLFGLTTVSNQYGVVEENPAKNSLSWLLLKYLLVNPQRAVGQEELYSVLWPDKPDIDPDGTARVRLRRLAA